jgi:hypothetical protein
MSNRLTAWLRRQKDSSASFVLERALQKTFRRYGRMLKFNLDSGQKSIQVEVLLQGEKEPITLIVQEYELIREASGTYLVVKKAAASREWLSVVLEEFVRGKRFAVPEKYASLTRLIA